MKPVFLREADRAMDLMGDRRAHLHRAVGAQFRCGNFEPGIPALKRLCRTDGCAIRGSRLAGESGERLLHGLELAERPAELLPLVDIADRQRERRIERAEAQIDIELPNFEQPEGAPADFEDHLDLMLDLQLLALQTDLTRVISFMIGKEQSPRPYPQIGVPDAHHPLSHHNDQPELVERMSRINRYHTELFARYLGKLRATPDGDGNLLDNMTILYGSGISNSTRHSGRNLPLLVMGGGAGSLRGGRHLEYGNDPGMANLLVTLMDKLGVPVDSHGASTGALQLDTLPGL